MSRDLTTVVRTLVAAHVLPDDPIAEYVVIRTRAGCWQRKDGAWNWQLGRVLPDGLEPMQIGSHYPLGECAAAAKRGALGVWRNRAGDVSVSCD